MDPAERQVLAPRLTELLDLTSILRMSRALGLSVEFERSFHEARILTDFRPLFGETPDVEAGLITNTLKIEYHERGAIKSFFVSIGPKDIVELEAVVKRARAKTDALARFAERVDLAVYDVERGDS